MKTIRLITVVGARPQFVKAAAVSRAIAAHNATDVGKRIDEKIIHTGQHYDANMSQVFFDELAIPAPAHHLGVGSGAHGAQTAAMLARIEPVLIDEKPEFVLLYGDTNSTLAGALAASKLGLRIAHVEAGLRSFNRAMPEEINRIVADRLSDLLFCPTETAERNLASEGVTRGVHRVGDVMYDSVLYHANAANGQSRILEKLSLTPREYYLATVHRAENTDDPARLTAIFDAFARLDRPVVLPLHPRTRKILDGRRAVVGADANEHAMAAQQKVGRVRPTLQNLATAANVRVIDPAAYLDMLTLEKHARAMLTDSGGMQKEAYWFGVPCITLREETEWVELVEVGANTLAGADSERIVAAVRAAGTARVEARAGLYGDGRSAEQIVGILTKG